MAESKIAQIINDCIVRSNGSDRILGIATVTLPEVKNKTENVSAMGTLAEMEVVIKGQMEAMSATIKFTNLSKDVMALGESIDISIKGQIQLADPEANGAPATQGFEAILKGTKKSRKFGELAPASKAEMEIEMTVTYFELKIEGEIIQKIDVFNYTWEENGKDLLETLKRNLGL